jgi:hypothetical protein
MADTLRELLYAKVRLDEVAAMLGNAPAPGEVLGVVVEIGLQGDTVMIAGYANGDARLLYDSGGGVLGDLYRFAGIAEAARALCATAQSAVQYLSPQSAVPPPPAEDVVQVSALTMEQLYTSQVPGPEIIEPGHELNSTFVAANNLFDQLQQLQANAEAQQQKGSRPE